MSSHAPMSARELGDWLVEARPGLDAAGIAAVHGVGPRLVADGATWISFSSSWGSGRLVRAADGSSTSTAHRYATGASVLDVAAPDTTAAHLESLVGMLAAKPG